MKTACKFYGAAPGEDHSSWCPNNREIEHTHEK
jgi:hypothetical protein